MSKRASKISCDISELARSMLLSYCMKHERSQGFIIEKMIRKFCVDEPEKEKPKKTPVKRFKPPTVEEVFNYCKERCNSVDAQKFIDHYEGNGWIRGTTKIKDWKACVRTWEGNDKDKQNQVGKTSGNLSACEDFING